MTAAALAQTYAAAFPNQRHWSEAEIASLLDSPGTQLIGGNTCFLIGRCAADEAEILIIATHPDHQRRGLARQILADFEAEIRPLASRVFLEVDATNSAARALYATCGFVQVGLRRGYFKHPNAAPTDALILAKNLT